MFTKYVGVEKTVTALWSGITSLLIDMTLLQGSW